MKLSKVMMWIAVGVAAVFIVWRVGFYPSAPAPKEKPAETQVVSESDGWDEWSEWDEWGEWDETRPGASESQIASGVTVPVASADVNEPKVSADANAPARLAEAGERRAFGRRPGQMDMGGDVGRSTRVAGFGDRAGPPSRSGRITDANDANEPMELLNLKNVEMRQIVQKIAEWTGKTVIPAEEAERVRVSIYAPEELPRSKALAHIYGALRLKGFVAEHLDNAIYVTPVRSAKLGFVPTIPAEEPLACW